MRQHPCHRIDRNSLFGKLTQSLSSDGFTVTETEDGAEITLPMTLPYWPIPEWVSSDFGAVFTVPIWLLYLAISRYFRPTEPPPRARFQIRPDVFRMEFVSHKTGDETSFECCPTDIAELRKNQYSKGLWVHVRGKTMHTFMEDFDDETVASAAQHVWPRIESIQDPSRKPGECPEADPPSEPSSK